MMGFVKGLNIENICKSIDINGVGESIILSSIKREQTRKNDQINTVDTQEEYSKECRGFEGFAGF